jgi:hypothetical protein
MDTVKFEIALSRYPPKGSRTPSPATAATVPTLPKEERPKEHIPSPLQDRKVPAVEETPSPVQLAPQEDKQSLGDRFHDWMEMDLEHGL